MISDFKFALRSLFKARSFSIIALLTLALGIGLNTSMFSVLNTLFLRTLPYAKPDALVRVYRVGLNGQSQLPHSPANFIDLQAQAKSFTQFAAAAWISNSLTMPGQSATRLRGMAVTNDFFAALGIQPILGRFFEPGENEPGRDQVVVLSHTFWETRFNSDATIVGRDLRINGEPVTVIGVMPAGFDDAQLWGVVDVWRPLTWTKEERENRGGNFLSVIARLSPGTTLASAETELVAINAQLAIAYPVTNARTGIKIVSLRESGEEPVIRTLTWFTLGLAGCVLLIACANLANLQFARNATRMREHAVRAALGASRMQLVRQSLTESVLLALIGGGLGLLVALWANDALGARLHLNGRTQLEIPVDWRVLGFALGIAAFTGMAFGLLPAWLSSRVDITDSLKQGVRGNSSGGAQHHIRRALIVAEVALALVLLTGAGFFIRGLDRFLERDLGWKKEQVLTASLSLPEQKYATEDALRAFYGRLDTKLRALPGVAQVSLAYSLPYNSYNWQQRFLVEGRPDPAPGAEPMRAVNGVTPTFFDALGLSLVEGRTFTEADVKTDITPTVINETMAKQYWPGESAVGKRIAHPAARDRWQEIIGVVRDVRFATNVSDANPRLQTYRLLEREPSSSFFIVMRSGLPPEALIEPLRRAIAEIDPDLPAHDVRPAVQAIERGLSNLSAVGRLLTGFALLGLLLAALGIYGVISAFVAQHTREIGVRLALGAQVQDVLRMVLAQGTTLTLLGIGVGLFGVVGVARILKSVLPAIPAPEVMTAAVIIGCLLVVTLVACWLPARRATRISPLEAIRNE